MIKNHFAGRNVLEHVRMEISDITARKNSVGSTMGDVGMQFCRVLFTRYIIIPTWTVFFAITATQLG